MMQLPVQLSANSYMLFVILEPENLRRMAENDPAIVYPHRLPGPWQGLNLDEIVLCAPTLENFAKVRSLLTSGKMREGVEILMGGFEYRPELGDNDTPYRPRP